MDLNFSTSVTSDVIEFLRAIKKGDIKKVNFFLTLGKFNSTMLVPGEDDCDENEQPLWDDEHEYGFTPLILACSNGQLKAVKLLIKAGADVNQDRWNTGEELKPIHFTDSLEILEYLLNHGADINATDRMNNTLINMVISKDDNTWANFLIDRGADPTIEVETGWGDNYDAIQNAIDKRNYPILKKIFNSGVDLKPYLVELASTGFTEFVAEILVQHKLDKPNINQALFRAAEYGHAQIVEMLIQNGADVNTRYCTEQEFSNAYWFPDYKITEMTPVEIAKEKGHSEVIKILIAAGAGD